MGVPVPAQSGDERELLSGRQRIWNLTLAVVAGQVGCLTLVIVVLAVLSGMWLDNQFNTRPIITIILLVISVPISLAVMFAVVRGAVKRIKVERNGESKPVHNMEENGIGRDKYS